MNRVGLLLVGALLTLSPFAVYVGALAQTPQVEEGVIGVGPIDFPTDDKEPLEFHVTYRVGGQDGTFATGYVVVQLPDGSFSGMTLCDDLSVLCESVTLPAKAALALADAGDSFPLAKEAAPSG